MKRTRTETQEVEIVDYFCDVCDRPQNTNRSCVVCGADLCRACFLFLPADFSDYPAWYCTECLRIGAPYLERLRELTREYDAATERIEAEWKAAARAAKEVAP